LVALPTTVERFLGDSKHFLRKHAATFHRRGCWKTFCRRGLLRTAAGRKRSDVTAVHKRSAVMGFSGAGNVLPSRRSDVAATKNVLTLRIDQNVLTSNVLTLRQSPLCWNVLPSRRLKRSAVVGLLPQTGFLQNVLVSRGLVHKCSVVVGMEQEMF
jgi:hypothetical protein